MTNNLVKWQHYKWFANNHYKLTHLLAKILALIFQIILQQLEEEFQDMMLEYSLTTGNLLKMCYLHSLTITLSLMNFINLFILIRVLKDLFMMKTHQVQPMLIFQTPLLITLNTTLMLFQMDFQFSFMQVNSITEMDQRHKKHGSITFNKQVKIKTFGLNQERFITLMEQQEEVKQLEDIIGK